MKRNELANVSIAEIIAAGDDDGYFLTHAQARAIKQAAKKGCLVWTRRHIVSVAHDNNFTIAPQPQQ